MELEVNLCVLYQNPGKQGQEIQNSTAELIIGLIQLVPLTHTSELSQEAMEVQNSISAFIVIYLLICQDDVFSTMSWCVKYAFSVLCSSGTFGVAST